MLLEDPAVLVGVERLVDRAQVERILVRPLKSEDAIHRPRFAGPLQHGFRREKQKSTAEAGRSKDAGEMGAMVRTGNR